MNIVVLKGNLTRDPEVRQVGETQVANFTIAVNRNFKKSDNTWSKETTYVDCEVWDSAAQRMGEYCSKGDPILVDGALKLDSWESDEGKRSKMKVRVSRFERLFRAPERSQELAEAEETTAAVAVGATPNAGGDDPDIPF